MTRALAIGAVLTLLITFPGNDALAQVKPGPATQPAAGAANAAQPQQADVPVKAVVLFSSGVGYFEHFGTVRGDGAAELRFKTDQINDVLKSLVLQDLDKGTVGAVTYPSQEPIDKTLKSFQVDITNNPPLAELLNQLRGAKIELALQGVLEEKLRGTIVGVEKRQDQVGGAVAGDTPRVIEYWMLNLKVGARLRSINLSQVRDFALEDPKLEEELDRALAALAQSRDQDKKPVTINFRGQGERRVRMGYVVETPIWKTSYRLVLTEAAGEDRTGGGAAGKGGPALLGAPASGSGAGPATRPAEGRAPTAEEMKALREEARVLKEWADAMDGQFGSIHPAVGSVRERQKAVEAAIAANKIPVAAAPALKPPADAIERKGLEDELEVLKPWLDGYERGYGKDHPANVSVRQRVTQLEKVLAAPAGGGAGAAGGAGDGAAPGSGPRPLGGSIFGPGGPATRPAGAAVAASALLPRGGKLQGWAIVENQTDNDWTDVQLSLVSGRPISFIQDLYHPLYVPRPVIFPDLYASLRPQTYQGGITAEDQEKLEKQRANAQDPDMNRQGRNGGGGQGGGGGGGSAGLFSQPENKKDAGGSPGPMDPTASIIAAASAAQLGELFEYTVGSVSLPRQRSAMIPIVADDVDVEKISIYNAAVLAEHPLNGVKVKNTTKKHLLQGPVTVLEAGTYAGDARIDDVPPGQSRLLSYGIDLNVRAEVMGEKTESAIQTAKILKGVLWLTQKLVDERTYILQNKGPAGRTVIVEHPREEGWRLLEPVAAEEQTSTLYRFRTRVEPGKTAHLPVRLEQVVQEQIGVLATDVNLLEQYARTGEIPEKVRNALAEAIRMKSAMTDSQHQIDERKKQIAEVSAEQARLRENMKTVSPNTEYYSRLLKKLDEQETMIERIQKESAELMKEVAKQKKALEDYLGKLDVGS